MDQLLIWWSWSRIGMVNGIGRGHSTQRHVNSWTPGLVGLHLFWREWMLPTSTGSFMWCYTIIPSWCWRSLKPRTTYCSYIDLCLLCLLTSYCDMDLYLLGLLTDDCDMDLCLLDLLTGDCDMSLYLIYLIVFSIDYCDMCSWLVCDTWWCYMLGEFHKTIRQTLPGVHMESAWSPHGVHMDSW